MYSMIILLRLEMVEAAMGCGKSSVQRQIEADKAAEDVETVHELRELVGTDLAGHYSDCYVTICY